MKKETKARIRLALLNAAEMIRGSTEVGLWPEDVDEETEEGLDKYREATQKAAKLITTLAKRYGGEE